jgi:hydroxymethylglutaryl-CoA lyase
VTKEKLELVEVSPRDGLQNEPDIVSTENKLALIDHILAAGFRRLEAGSFVNPKKVPQMADGDAVFAGLPKRNDATFIALALNLRGVERALAAGATEINYVFCASDGFSIRNNGGTVEETFRVWPEVAAAAKQGGARLSATVSTAFGCPFDGEVPVRRVVEVAERCDPREHPIARALSQHPQHRARERRGGRGRGRARAGWLARGYRRLPVRAGRCR